MTPPPDHRQQLEDIIVRQLSTQRGRSSVPVDAPVQASKQVILDAVIEWAHAEFSVITDELDRLRGELASTRRRHALITVRADSRLAPFIRWLQKGIR